MCGVVGYTDGDQTAPILLNDLEELKYHGHDSAGMAVYIGSALRIVKSRRRLQVLSNLIDDGKSLQGTIGIGHTHRATHGKSSDINSHPQVSNPGKFVVAYNGTIENCQETKEKFLKKGVSFVSETDTEVVTQLLKYYYDGDILNVFIRVIPRLQGSYASSMLCMDDPDKLHVVRKNSPLVAGLDEHENYVAPDTPSILNRTHDFYRLKDNEIAQLARGSVQVRGLEEEPIEKELVHIDRDLSIAEKSGYEHFMFKKVMEQLKALRDTISPRIKDGHIVLDNVTFMARWLQEFNCINTMAYGSAYHVGVVAKYVIEKLTRILVEVDATSEFRYRHSILDNDSLVIVVSQSGETAGTLVALHETKRLGAYVIPTMNVMGGSITNGSDDVLYAWIGPEIVVATVRAYSTQLAAVYLPAIYMVNLLGRLMPGGYADHAKELQELPDKVERTLENKEDIQYFASEHFSVRDIFFIGRNLDYAAPLEGSLKLKEVSYIRSGAYATDGLKHGTISLTKKGMLVAAIVTHQQLLEKMMNNTIEVRSRGAPVLGLTTEDGTQEIGKDTDFLSSVPTVCEIMRPPLAVIPLQLSVYYVAPMRGYDIDKSCSLAKSVTVG